MGRWLSITIPGPAFYVGLIFATVKLICAEDLLIIYVGRRANWSTHFFVNKALRWSYPYLGTTSTCCTLVVRYYDKTYCGSLFSCMVAESQPEKGALELLGHPSLDIFIGAEPRMGAYYRFQNAGKWLLIVNRGHIQITGSVTHSLLEIRSDIRPKIVNFDLPFKAFLKTGIGSGPQTDPKVTMVLRLEYAT